MTTCRHSPSLPCTGAFSLPAVPDCNNDCRGPVGAQPTKPAAPVREEEKTMPEARGAVVRTGRGVPMEIGECPRCHVHGVKLKVSDTFFAGGKGCHKCYKKAQNAATRAAKGQEAPSPAKATKAPGAPKEPRPVPIAKPRPAEAAQTPSGAVLTLTFRLTLGPGLTVAALTEVLRDLPAGAELVG